MGTRSGGRASERGRQPRRRPPRLGWWRLAAALLGLATLLHAGLACRETPPAPRPARPLLLVGIDGASFERIEPLRAAGRLPQLARLMEAGAFGPLATLEPTVSPAIWTTIATGRPPAEHGILGFDGVPGRGMTTLPTSQMRQVRAFWNILSEHARSVGVIGWWATWPAEPVTGYLVSDRVPYTRMEAAADTERRNAFEIHPRELAVEIRPLVRIPEAIPAEAMQHFTRLSEDELGPRVSRADHHRARLVSEFRYVHQADRSTADIAVHLLRTRPTDVTAVAFTGVDLVSHLAWHYMEPEKFPGYAIEAADVEKLGGLIDRYYEYTDRLLGELLAASDREQDVIVFSDHGFGATGSLPWSGGHGRLTPGAPIAPDGILILAGPSVRAGARIEGADVLDLAPTLLHLQGLPAAQDMPGRVLVEALREEAGAERLPPRVRSYEMGPRAQPAAEALAAPELDADLLEKLRRLGYFE